MNSDRFRRQQMLAERKEVIMSLFSLQGREGVQNKGGDLQQRAVAQRGTDQGAAEPARERRRK